MLDIKSLARVFFPSNILNTLLFFDGIKHCCWQGDNAIIFLPLDVTCSFFLDTQKIFFPLSLKFSNFTRMYHSVGHFKSIFLGIECALSICSFKSLYFRRVLLNYGFQYLFRSLSLDLFFQGLPLFLCWIFFGYLQYCYLVVNLFYLFLHFFLILKFFMFSFLFLLR